VTGYIHFDKDGFGEFRFGVVCGSMECRIEKLGEFDRIEISWEGESETDLTCKRSRAMIIGKRSNGRLFVHERDDS